VYNVHTFFLGRNFLSGRLSTLKPKKRF